MGCRVGCLVLGLQYSTLETQADAGKKKDETDKDDLAAAPTTLVEGDVRVTNHDEHRALGPLLAP